MKTNDKELNIIFDVVHSCIYNEEWWRVWDYPCPVGVCLWLDRKRNGKESRPVSIVGRTYQ